MAGHSSHVPSAGNNDTRHYDPSRIPSFMGYDQLPLLLPPPSYSLPPSVHHWLVRMGERLYEVTSPNSLCNVFCPGLRPDNLNLHINFYEEKNWHYDRHMGPFDPTKNTQLWFPGKEWRALIVSSTAGNLHDCPKYNQSLISGGMMVTHNRHWTDTQQIHQQINKDESRDG